MDKLEGGNLAQFKIQTLYNIQKIKSLGSQLISALKYLASKNLIHRDIKPQNIMLTKD